MTFNPATPVLVIEPNLLAKNLLRKALVRLGVAEIDTTEVASKGMGMIGRKAYGLIICEYFMSPMNGFDVMRELQKDPRTARIPFILTSTQESELALTARARDLLRQLAVRPITTDVLSRKIAQACDIAARAA